MQFVYEDYDANDGVVTGAKAFNQNYPISNVATSYVGYVANINAPNATQMTSHTGKLSQDHFDVISLGPDTLDEEEFYATIFDFIQSKGY